MTQLIDTHCHVNFETYDNDRETMLQRAFDGGVGQILCIGMMPEGGRSALALARKYPGRVFASVGVHPYDAELLTPEVMHEMELLLAEPEMVLCGEMGLDTVKAPAPIEIQLTAFADQIRLANRTCKPVCIHCRDAFPLIRQVFEETGPPEHGGFAHCFSDGPAEALQWVEWGLKVSFAGQVTFKNAESLREAVRVLTPHDVVVETDSPFLAPAPHRGKRNEPSYVKLTASRLAEEWGLSFEEVARITSENARQVLKLPPFVA